MLARNAEALYWIGMITAFFVLVSKLPGDVGFSGALTVAGFDPSSGAGITADLAVFSAFGGFGVSCITGLSVQSTTGVVGVEAVPVEATLACLAADLPLGVIPNIEYEQATFQLNVGDRLIFLSDGVVEAANAHGELFGFERTQQVSNESARYIAQTAKRFGQTDDITVVSLYFAARAGNRKPREEVPVS